MRSLTISLILTGLSFPRIKSNQILDEDNLAMQVFIIEQGFNWLIYWLIHLIIFNDSLNI